MDGERMPPDGAPESSLTVDARGLACPLPVIRTKRGIASVDLGAIVHVLATDSGSIADFAAWTRSTGHELVAARHVGDVFQFWIRRTH
jgi:tRNA 2-thiouridine synthesizing protein A